ncbi:uncharacterized protein [Macrobrachium rosenbergii]|uniref:uncharacterized protein n=1 Tax=Macrobrachium rosenbergii TaxID=79674 RepID=UPI0034D636E2
MTPLIMLAQIMVLLLSLRVELISSLTVMRFQEDRVPRTDTTAIYKGQLDRNWKMDSVTLCGRFQLFILHGWATFFHLRDTEGRIMMLTGELWVERVRPVLARNWNFQILKENLWMFRWYHICFTYNHTKKLIGTYINGQLNNHQEYDIGRPIIGNYASLGQGQTPERSFSGDLTQVNVWDRALTEDEIRNIALCKDDLQGNYISWEVGWTLFNVTSYEISLTKLCDGEEVKNHFWFPDIPFKTAQYLCLALGTELPRPTTLKDIADLTALANETFPGDDRCTWDYWTSLTDVEEEGVWKFYDGQIPDILLWEQQEPNGLHYENCAVIFPVGMSDIDCKTNKKCVVCTFTGQQRFSLLGTCESELRNVFLIAYQDSIGELYFMGYGAYFIRKQEGRWIWVDDVQNQTIARMEETTPYYPMGRRWWVLEKVVCGQNPGSRRRLLLTPCQYNEFTCDDGSCIPHHERCDLKYDCRDNSDEALCHLVLKPDDYQEQLPPRSTQNSSDSLLIILLVSIETLSVDTLAMTMEVSYELMLTWEDSRLQYLNLKVSNTLNILEDEAMSSLWTPEVSFINTNDNHHTRVDADATMMIDRRAETRTRDEAAPEEVDVYPGTRNTLSIKRKYGTVYKCDFNLELYPFDVQQCSMHLRITSASKSFLLFDAVNSSVKYSGEIILREYRVSIQTPSDSWRDGESAWARVLRMRGGVADASDSPSEVRVRVPLIRLYGYAILNIYVPTVVLLIVSYLTLFFRASIFDVRMMGSLFSQVSETLPKTSYFKMVDVWLLFCIGITFLVIIFHAVIDSILYQGANQGASLPTTGNSWLANGKSTSEDVTYTNIGKRMVLLAKVVTMIVFVIFNMAYWVYIVY